MKTPETFAGKWRITESELWDEDALDLVVPAHVTFDANGLGSFQMGYESLSGVGIGKIGPSP